MSKEKGARRLSEVQPERLAALNAGLVESRNLAEGLALNFADLLRTVVAERIAEDEELAQLAALPITRRMEAAGSVLARLGDSAQELISHPSDSIRGAMAYALVRGTDDVESALIAVRPLADDTHFGVREWAWMAARPRIASGLTRALECLAPWASEASPSLRRFASEATRPRGVWCQQLRPLVANPEPGLIILEKLRADPDKYVQDSVGNWLNDAAKSRPDWVEGVTRRWERESPGETTKRIIRRGRRSM
jgi:3-methyladenine DNA glycosylase AlkC